MAAKRTTGRGGRKASSRSVKGGGRSSKTRRTGASARKGGGRIPKGTGARALDGLFRPRSVAVIGASRRRQSIGHEVVANLLGNGFEGPVYPVNPKAEVVHSMHCYRSLASIPGPVDLAVVVVPAAGVLKVARECARKKVRGMVVVSAGFREIGPNGAALEAELRRLVKRAGIRLVGPNCMGILNTEDGVRLNASFAATTPTPGPVAFVSQSGALGEAILSDAKEVGIGIRMFASVGNSADVGADQLCEYWAEDEGVSLILLYLESFGDPARFKAVAERLRGRKPIIAVKSGRTAAGARAAGSHTGSVAGEDRAVDTFLMQCGVLRAESLREMFSFAEALLHQPRPKGARVGVVTNAGGPGILATDALEGRGLKLAELAPSTRKALSRLLPPEASVQNPVDLIASADEHRYRKAVRTVVRDRNVDILIVLFVSPIMIDAHAVALAIIEETRDSGKPVVTCVMGRKGGDEAVRTLKEAGIPVYRFPEEAAQTVAGMIRYAELAEEPAGRPKRFEVDRRKAARILAKAGSRGGGWLESEEVRRLLGIYGIPFVPTRIAGSPAEALAAAHDLGYPVVVKAAAKDLVHKSDCGGVRIDLHGGDEVFEAALSLERALAGRVVDLRFEVQRMAPGHRELLLGFTRDSKFGPLLAVGLGGVHVEVLRDIAIRVGPLSDADPAAMLDDLRGAPLLGPYRGEAPIDRALVEECLLRLNQLAFDFPEIAELDLNPFMAAPRGVPSYAVDGRIRVEEPGVLG